MGKIVIYRDGQPHLDLVGRGRRTINSATQTKVILSDDSVSLRVSSNAVLDIAVNDYFEVFGDFYRINHPPTVKKNNERSYEYNITAQGLMFDLMRCKFFNADGTGVKTTFDFPIIGNLEMFLTVVANNMHRFSNLWEVGNIANTTETKTITFNSDTCLSALQKICQEFKTEFWVKNEGGKFKIHTGQFGSTLPVPFEYGKGKGLYTLSRNNVNEDGIINRLYLEGGSENIPADYRNFSEKLKFSNEGYIEDAALISSNGLKEGSIDFEDIYPHRTGKITAVSSTSFSDSTMDFDLNEKEADGITTKYLVAGQTAKMHFNKGNLAGYEFEITKYDHATKTFTIIPFDNGNGQVFPDEKTAAFQFAVGDEYVLLDIVMPQTYITNAENELLAKGREQFDLLKQAKVSYDLDIASDYLPRLPKLPEIGDLVNVRDSALGIDKTLRVNEISRNFIDNGEWDDFRYKVTIADAYEIDFESKMILQVRDIRNVVNVQKIDQLRLSKLGLKVTEELKDSIFDTDGYFDTQNIKPFSIETGMLTVGAKSQQLSTNLIFETNVALNPNNIKAGLSKLYSQTFDKVWDLDSFNTVLPDNALRYVYAKASKSGNVGSIFISTEKRQFDADPNDYYFLLGMLSSVIEGSRVFVPTIGSTTITGGLIRTGTISSNDGQTTFNLNTGEITGKITFRAGSTGYNNLGDKPDLEALKDAAIYAAKAYSDAQDSLFKTIANAYADGIVTAAEERSVKDATNKADAAKTYAAAQDALLNIQLQAYADGQINSSEQDQINYANQVLTNAKAYADAQDNLAKIAVAAYADGIVDAAEAAAIADATAKMNEAKATAQGLANNIQIGGRNLFLRSKVGFYDGSLGVFVNNGIKITGVADSPSTVRISNAFPEFGDYTISFDGFSSSDADFMLQVDDINISPVIFGTVRKKYAFTFKKLDTGYNFIDFQNLKGVTYFIENLKLEKGNKATDWTPAPEDVQAQIDVNKAGNTANSAMIGAHSALIGQLNDKTDWLSPTIDPNINAIMAGTLAVGNSSDGVTAVISGKKQFGAKDLRIASGKNQTGKFNWELTDDGVQVMRHPNGSIGFEFGVINGELTLNGFSSSGFKLFELSPNKGLVNVAYTPESWSPQKELFLGTSYNEADFINLLKNKISYQYTDYGSNSINGKRYKTEFSISDTDTIYLYNNGSHPANKDFEINNGYKINSSSRTDNVTDGWYWFKVANIQSTEWGIDSYPYETAIIASFYRISGGKVVEIKSINFNYTI